MGASRLRYMVGDIGRCANWKSFEIETICIQCCLVIVDAVELSEKVEMKLQKWISWLFKNPDNGRNSFSAQLCDSRHLTYF